MNTKFNFSFTFSVMILLVFAYITFLGLVYWKGGDFVLPACLTIGLIAVVPLCVFIMCISRATRWKKIGTIGQVFFGLIILVTLLSAAFPFTNFLRVIHDSDNIYEKVGATCESALNLDKSYNEYVENRLEDYKANLELISRGKRINPSQYQECLAGAHGNSDQEKIDGLVKSLSNKLLPESTSKIVSERHEWLESAKKASVWNPLTPSNINKVDEQVNNYLANYVELSSVTYKGEQAGVFSYSEFKSQLQDLTDTYQTLQSPSLIAIIISIVCFFIMLLPYLLTEKEIAGREDKSNNKKHHFKKTNIN